MEAVRQTIAKRKHNTEEQTTIATGKRLIDPLKPTLGGGDIKLVMSSTQQSKIIINRHHKKNRAKSKQR